MTTERTPQDVLRELRQPSCKGIGHPTCLAFNVTVEGGGWAEPIEAFVVPRGTPSCVYAVAQNALIDKAIAEAPDSPPDDEEWDEMTESEKRALAAPDTLSEKPGLPDNDVEITLTRDLVLRAVDLRAIAWNTLCAVPVDGADWSRFWRKLHELREAVNRVEHEQIRAAYAASFGKDDSNSRPDPDRRILDENWRIVPESGSTDSEGR